MLEPEEGLGQSPQAGSGWRGEGLVPGQAGGLCLRVLAPQPGLGPQRPWCVSCPPYPRCSGPRRARAGLGTVFFPAVSVLWNGGAGADQVSKAKMGCWGRQGKEGKLTDHRRKPRWLCWPLGPGHPVPPPRCLRHRTLRPDQEYTGPCCSLCLECPCPSIHPARLCSSITFSVKPSLTSMGRG